MEAYNDVLASLGLPPRNIVIKEIQGRLEAFDVSRKHDYKGELGELLLDLLVEFNSRWPKSSQELQEVIPAEMSYRTT